MKNTMLYLCWRYLCRFVVLLFKNCSADPRTGNSLTSPEFTLASDQELTFTMEFLANNNAPLSVYKTSMLGRTSTLLGFYSPPLDTSADLTNITHSICLPAGTYQLVFIASELENADESTAILREVNLESSCTYTSLAGKATVLSTYIITAVSFYRFLQFSARQGNAVISSFNETAA